MDAALDAVDVRAGSQLVVFKPMPDLYVGLRLTSAAQYAMMAAIDASPDNGKVNWDPIAKQYFVMKKDTENVRLNFPGVVTLKLGDVKPAKRTYSMGSVCLNGVDYSVTVTPTEGMVKQQSDDAVVAWQLKGFHPQPAPAKDDEAEATEISQPTCPCKLSWTDVVLPQCTLQLPQLVLCPPDAGTKNPIVLSRPLFMAESAFEREVAAKRAARKRQAVGVMDDVDVDSKFPRLSSPEPSI